METNVKNGVNKFKELVANQGELTEFLEKYPTVEVAEMIEDLDTGDMLHCLDLLPPERQGAIFSELQMTRQLSFFQQVSKKRFAPIFEHMYSDHRADLFQHFTQQEKTAILPFLSGEVRENVIHLSAYDPETAGGIMSTDFTAIREDLSCRQAIEQIRSSSTKNLIYYVYVVDENMRLLGFASLKDIIMADPSTMVREIYHREFAYSMVEEDREEVAKKVEKYDLVAIPVLNSENQLIGLVHHDDALEVIRAEHTEDMEKFMGIVPGDEILDYNQTSTFGHFRKRVVWLSLLAVLGVISGIIIHSFEETLATLIILAMYIPMVADTGGNAGSQAATVVIRALALGQLKLADWLRIIWKEARIAFLLAIVLGIIAYGKVLWLSWNTHIPPEYDLFFLAFGISLALSFQVITSTVVGACLPLVVKRFGGDPAVAASPAITTTVDITGLLIYFGIAMMLFF